MVAAATPRDYEPRATPGCGRRRPLRPPHPLRNGNGLGMGSRNGYQHPGIPGERGPILGVPGWCRPRVPIHGYHHREPTRPRALAQPRSGTGDLQIFASRVLSD
eukprot:scaffold30499_cov34-Phaeocystis_antarctica.AAC.1